MFESKPSAFVVVARAIGLATVPTEMPSRMARGHRLMPQERQWSGRALRCMRPFWCRRLALASLILDVVEHCGTGNVELLFPHAAERGKACPTPKKENNLFRFGNGQEEMSAKVALIPIGIHGHEGYVEAAVISGDAPLLLSRTTMKSLKGVVDFSAETVSILGGAARPLTTNEAGQYCHQCYAIS